MGLFMDLWILQYLNTTLSFLDLDCLALYKAFSEMCQCSVLVAHSDLAFKKTFSY